MSAITGQRESYRAHEEFTQTVKNDGWWPDVDIKLLRASLRLTGDVTDVRLVRETKRALRWVNNELALWKLKRQEEGYTSLEDVPLREHEGNSEALIEHYQDAIFSHVDAKLSEQYRKTDTTGAGDKRADMIEPRITEALRDKHLSVKAILDYDVASHLTISVELI